MLVVTMASSTFALAVIAVLAANIIREFDISRQQLGLLVTASAVAGALLAPFLGPWADRIGARNATLFSLASSAVALGAMAIAPTFAWLVAATLVTGVTQAIANPATNKLIAVHVPAGRRGVATGIKQSGVQAGSAIGGLMLPPIALAVGWRWGIALGALVPLACILLTLSTIQAERTVAGFRPSGIGLAADGIGRVAAYGFLLGLGGTAVFTYLPLFGQERLGLDPVTAGATVSVMGAMGVVGRIAWGRVAETRFGSDRALAIIAGISVIVGLGLLAAPVLGPWMVWPVAVLTGLSASSWNAVGMLAVIQKVPPERAGRASGTVMFGFLGGLGLGAPIFGRSVDLLGDYRVGWAVITVIFALALLLVVGRWGQSTAGV